MREIKFRAKHGKEWVYGDLHLNSGKMSHIHPDPFTSKSIDPDTVGQFTGLKDKNGKEIYEGDIVRYTDMDSFVVNPDCDPWLHFRRSYAIVRETVVVFEDGMFCSDEGHPICYLGWESIKDLRECLDVPDGEDCDVDGTIIDESLLGIEVIGNIYDNPELLTK